MKKTITVDRLSFITKLSRATIRTILDRVELFKYKLACNKYELTIDFIDYLIVFFEDRKKAKNKYLEKYDKAVKKLKSFKKRIE